MALPVLSAPLKWETHDGYRVTQLSVPANGKTGFTLLTPEQTGVFFTNELEYHRSEANQNLLNGAGVAAGDFDGDGICDLYFCNLQGVNGLFRNKGNWSFENVTAKAGVACTNQTSRGVVFADINGDGHLDILVSSLSGPNACFLNDGAGHFKDVTEAAGLVISKAGGHSLTLADVDGDGDLDLYIANYGENAILRSGGDLSVRTVGGRTVVTGRHAARVKIIGGQFIELGQPDVLSLNDGKGIFSAVPWTGGAFLNEAGEPLKAPPPDMGLSAMFRDINGDGAPDLYVCNDFQTPDRIWINDGHGKFRLIDPMAIRTTCHFSMGVDFADLDRDGREEFFVSDMLSRFHNLLMRQIGATNPTPEQVGEKLDRPQVRRNTLYWNRGDGTYAEIANYAGLDASDWTWSVVFLDVDLDGYEDLLVSNGHAYDTQDMDMIEKAPSPIAGITGMRLGKNLKDFPPLQTQNYLFRNRGNLTFEEIGSQWGFNSTNVSHGISLADLDNDGDLDVVVSCLWKPPLIYRNESSAPRIAVRLKGKAPNVQGIGGKITVRGGAVPLQTQQVICGGRYLSGDDPMRVFAAGSLTNHMTVEVTWRSGLRSVIEGAKPNCIYEIDESKARAVPAEKILDRPPPLFASQPLSHTHIDAAFNDFERQPLLHKLLSQAGPGVAWYDWDNDGHEDVIVSGGTGGTLALFRNDGKGGFLRVSGTNANSDDQLGIVGCVLSPGKRSLLIANANYEHPDPNAAFLERREASGQQSNLKLPSDLISPGPIAIADLDGDGDLDVFAGGRALPARYPEASRSLVYRNNSGTLELDTANSEVLRKAGIVNGALFSDLDGDGWPDLILACEFGPVRVFHNDSGKLTEITENVGLQKFPGWWNGVTTGDLDGDGKLDIIVGNWGLNSSYKAPTPDRPVRFYYGDFDDNGSVDIIESVVDPLSGKIAQRRDMQILASGLPLIRTRFPTHKAYSEANFETVMADWMPKAKVVQANTLASMVFLNRGDHFEAVQMPREAQWAPAIGVNVADFDGDGHEDVFLSQNFFAMRLEEPRLDAGRGLLLLGDGKGSLTPMPGQESGIKVYGEQRGSAVADFDEDGRPDLVVTQNRGATQLFRNQSAKPGLRVRLVGSPANPDAIGATIRLKFGGRFGPAREIHAGSGYLSQDSAVQVLANPENPTGIWVRWPGGKVTTSEVEQGAKSVTVAAPR